MMYTGHTYRTVIGKLTEILFTLVIPKTKTPTEVDPYSETKGRHRR